MGLRAREQGQFNRQSWFKAVGTSERDAPAELGLRALHGGGAISARAWGVSRSSPGASEEMRCGPGRGAEMMVKEQEGIWNDWRISCEGGRGQRVAAGGGPVNPYKPGWELDFEPESPWEGE